MKWLSRDMAVLSVVLTSTSETKVTLVSWRSCMTWCWRSIGLLIPLSQLGVRNSHFEVRLKNLHSVCCVLVGSVLIVLLFINCTAFLLLLHTTRSLFKFSFFKISYPYCFLKLEDVLWHPIVSLLWPWLLTFDLQILIGSLTSACEYSLVVFIEIARVVHEMSW